MDLSLRRAASFQSTGGASNASPGSAKPSISALFDAALKAQSLATNSQSGGQRSQGISGAEASQPSAGPPASSANALAGLLTHTWNPQTELRLLDERVAAHQRIVEQARAYLQSEIARGQRRNSEPETSKKRFEPWQQLTHDRVVRQADRALSRAVAELNRAQEQRNWLAQRLGLDLKSSPSIG